jgi:hypothetical protein
VRLRIGSLGCFGLGLTLLATAASAQPITLVTSSTQGFSTNANLGDLGFPSGNPPWFPPPGTFGGTQDQIFASAPDLSAASAILGDWLGNPGALNANWTGPQALPGVWPINNELAIVYAVDAGPGVTDLTASFTLIDNGVHVWVNGVWRFGARDPEGRAWTGIPLGSLGPGTNYIQILLEDSGGAVAYSGVSIQGTEIPEPGSLGLAALGLAATACARRVARRAR